MIRTFYTPDSNIVALSIPDRYVGTELEIIIFPLKEPVYEMTGSTKMPIFGCAKGQFVMSDDFDAPLDDFKEYME
ncbi:MAG: DUF2281 domain-containing protein [Prevotellaceae bacterium]|jgi:hypothetical protein|nr:DUF2281 domain-containing protein [Prevotellaceae bacterium]